MKRGLKVWFFLVVVLISLWCVAGVRATDYYVNATTGSDASNGLTPGTAWQTISKVNGEWFPPGGNIYFERDQIWREQLTIPSSGSSGNPITFDAYGSGAKPIINGADLVTGWEDNGSNVWNASLTTEPNQVFFNGTRGTEVAYGDIDATNEWNWSSNILRVYSTSDPDIVYTNPGIEASQRSHGIYGTARNYITIQDFRLEKANLYGGELQWRSNNWIIDNNEMAYNYKSGLFSSGGTDGACDNTTVSNNTVSYNGASGINVNSNVTGWIIENNIVHHNSALDDVDFTAGIYFWGDNNVDYVKNFIIQNNTVYENGYDGQELWRGVGIWIDEGGTGNIVRYNHVYDNHCHGIYIESTDGVEVYYNLCYGQNEHGYDGGIALIRDVNSNKIYNNVCYGNSFGLYVDGTTDSGTTTINNNLVKNNIFDGNDGGEFHANNGGENDGTEGTGNVYEYNCLGTEYAAFVIWGANSKSTYDAWETAYGGSTHSVESDPLMTDAANNDFTLQSDSPCIDNGTDVGLSLDYASISVPLGGGPDIGAYEYNDTVAPTISFSCSPTSVTAGGTITCSCSATDDIDSNPTVSYTVNPSTSNTGTFTTRCTVTDNSGNSASSSISYTVSSSGGGGYPTYKPTQEQLEEGYEKTLYKNYKIQFEFNNETHTIELDDIVNETAIITISSEPVTFNLTVNETKKLNLDDDNYYDLQVFLKDINDYEADLVVKPIHEEIFEEDEEKPAAEEEKPKWWIWLVLALIIVVLVIIVMYKHKKEKATNITNRRFYRTWLY